MAGPGTLRRPRRALPYQGRREIAVPPYRSFDIEPTQGPPDPPDTPPRSTDRAYLWLAVTIGVIPLLGAALCGHWSDTELGVGTALVAITAPALVRSYLKGS